MMSPWSQPPAWSTAAQVGVRLGRAVCREAQEEVGAPEPAVAVPVAAGVAHRGPVVREPATVVVVQPLPGLDDRADEVGCVHQVGPRRVRTAVQRVLVGDQERWLELGPGRCAAVAAEGAVVGGGVVGRGGVLEAGVVEAGVFAAGVVRGLVGRGVVEAGVLGAGLVGSRGLGAVVEPRSSELVSTLVSSLEESSNPVSSVGSSVLNSSSVGMAGPLGRHRAAPWRRGASSGREARRVRPDTSRRRGGCYASGSQPRTSWMRASQ